ncbi:MAG: hypothetical protein JRN62_02895 [Nitrososphaerota archaeon]|jgi:hypothetical protein|nr:hypothetical protein [Nitrososphaerota archaeon]
MDLIDPRLRDITDALDRKYFDLDPHEKALVASEIQAGAGTGQTATTTPDGAPALEVPIADTVRLVLQFTTDDPRPDIPPTPMTTTMRFGLSGVEPGSLMAALARGKQERVAIADAMKTLLLTAQELVDETRRNNPQEPPSTVSDPSILLQLYDRPDAQETAHT